MRLSRLSFQVWAFVVLFTLLPGFCFAQGVTGTITGVITDPSHASVPDAVVLCKNAATVFARLNSRRSASA